MNPFVDALNNNKILWGVTMLMLNIGSRYVVGDLGKFHEYILASEITKKIIVFSMFFVATRDIITAFLLTVLYIFVIDGILHEKRKFCVIPKKYIVSQEQKLSEEQYLAAKAIVAKYESEDRNTNSQTIVVDENYGKYAARIRALNAT